MTEPLTSGDMIFPALLRGEAHLFLKTLQYDFALRNYEQGRYNIHMTVDLSMM
jgi:hypothetical protein